MKSAYVAGSYEAGNDQIFESIRSAIAEASSTLSEPIQLTREGFSHNVRGSAQESLYSSIAQAAVVIADLSLNAPRVLWEVGYAAALAKPVILLTQDIGEVPTHLAPSAVLIYHQTAPLTQLSSRLADTLVKLLAPTTVREGPSLARQAPPRTVFFSYSHADSDYLARILVHLRPLEQRGLLTLWSDTRIRAGARWQEEIQTALANARTAVLLISADFLASGFISTSELPPLLSAAEQTGTRLISVILKPSGFLRDPALSRLQTLNPPSQPVIRMSEADREDLYAKLADELAADLSTP